MKKLNKILVSSGAVVALGLWGLPEVLRLGAEHWLQEQGFQPATIEDIDLNLFAGTFAISNLQLGNQGKPEISVGHLSADLEVLALIDRHILLRQLQLTDSQLTPYRLADGRFQLAFVQPATSTEAEPEPQAQTEPSEPWAFGIDQLLINSLQVTFTDQQLATPGSFNFSFEQLKLEQLYSWQPELAGKLSLTAQINQAPLQLQAELQPFANPIAATMKLQHQDFQLASVQPWLAEDMQVSGWLSNDIDLQLVLDPQQPQAADVQFTVQPQLKKLQAKLAENTLALDYLQLNTTGQLQKQQLQLAPQLTLNQLTTEQEPHQLQLESLKLQPSAITVDLSSQDLQLQLAPLNLEKLQLVTDNALAAKIGAVGLQQLEVSKNKQLAAKIGQFSIDDFQANIQQQPLAAVERIAIEKIDFSQQQENSAQQLSAELNGFSLSQLALEQSRKKWFELQNISLNHLQFSQAEKNTDIALGDLTFSSFSGELQRTADGKIPLLEQWLDRVNSLVPAPENIPDANQPQAVASNQNTTDSTLTDGISEASTEDAVQPNIKLAKLHLDGHFKFSDLQPQPHLNTDFQLTQLEVNDVNTSDPQHLSPVSLQANIGEYGALNISGDVAPLSQQVKLKGELKHIDLPKFSGYLEPVLGYQISLGQLSNDFTVALADQKLQLENQILLKQLEIEPTDQETIDRLSKQLTMPIDRALSLLRNGDGDIELSLPVSGPLDQLEVDPGDIIATATTNAIKAASVAYLKHLLQPWGTAISLAQYAGELLSDVSLDPVKFEPGSSELNPQGEEYLQKLSLLTKERPDLQLKLCGVAGKYDRLWVEEQIILNSQKEADKKPADNSQAENETLEQLTAEAQLQQQQALLKSQVAEIKKQLGSVAKARADGVKRHLVKQYGVDPGRLLLCKPKLEDEAVPSVAVGI